LKKQILIRTTLLLSIISVGSQAQVAKHQVFAAVGYVSNTIDYTIGEVLTQTLGSSLSVTQGFHQPRLRIVGIAQITNTPSVIVYPNPLESSIFIEVKDRLDVIHMTLIDVQGKALKRFIVSAKNLEIPITDLASGIYTLISQTDKGSIIARHKIVKL
jgi:hypothetical protein